MLDPAQERRLVHQLTDFNQRTGHALVVVTVQSIGEDDIADYTLELFNSWGVGDAEKDNGVMLLVAPNERQVRIATGFGMEKRLPDDLAAQIIRVNITPRFRVGAMADGIEDGVEAITSAMTQP